MFPVKMGVRWGRGEGSGQARGGSGRVRDDEEAESELAARASRLPNRSDGRNI